MEAGDEDELRRAEELHPEEGCDCRGPMRSVTALTEGDDEPLGGISRGSEDGDADRSLGGGLGCGG